MHYYYYYGYHYGGDQMHVYEGPSMGWLIFKWIMILMLFSLLLWLFVVICIYERVNVYDD